MLKRRINMMVVGLIFLCSTMFYKFTYLGPVQKGGDILGVGVIFLLMILHLVYSPRRNHKKHFNVPIFFIFLALLTSTITAYLGRDQSLVHSFLGHGAIYYYLLYYLLHELDMEVKDLEKLMIVFGFFYIAVYLLQYFAYPRILFEAGMQEDRGTLRIYLPGYNFLVLAYYMILQRFLRSNKVKYLAFLMTVLIIVVLRGGRQSVAMFTLVSALFIMIDRQVRSRMFMVFLGAVGAVSIFLLFQEIFMELFSSTQQNMAAGGEYIRFRSARFFLTEFFEQPVAYLTGNGMYYAQSTYGRNIGVISLKYHFFLGDLGIVGNYVMYGAFFIIGVMGIIVRAFKIKVMADQTYLKYMFFVIAVTLIAGGGFANAPFICMVTALLYIIDQSNRERNQEEIPADVNGKNIEHKV